MPWQFALSLAIALLCVALYTWRLEYRLHGQSGDTAAAQVIPIALLSGQGFDLGGLPGAEELGYAAAVVDGRLVSLYPVLPGIVNTPAYWIGSRLGADLSQWTTRARLSFWTGTVVTAAAVALLLQAMLTVAPRPALAVAIALAVAFGTTYFSVASRGVWQHGISVALLAAALALAAREGSGAWRAAGIGLLLGLAVVNRPTNVIPALGLVVYWWSGTPSRRLAWAAAAGASIPFLAMRWYAWAYFGDPLFPAEYPILVLVGDGAVTSSSLIERLAGLLLSPSRGLLVFSPFLAVLLASGFTTRSRERWLAAGALATVLVYVAWPNWWGGFSFGPRLLTEAIPFAAMAGYVALATRPRRALLVAFGVSAVVSVVIHTAGALYYPCLSTEAKAEEKLWSVRESEMACCLARLAHLRR